MEENVEVKDVQKTEYLDKNGLDMLWTKVKENTHNQVEVERNRAITQETRIIETKADKSELDNYVSNTALTALEKKVSANTAAISGKQDAGNYLHYKTLNNDGYYEIPSVCVINEDDGTATSMTSDEIKVNDENLGYTIITTDGVSNKYATDVDFALGFILNRNGIKLQGGDNNHVLTSNGSTIDITEYAKKSEVADKVDTTALTALEEKVTANTTAIEGKQDVGNYIPFDKTDGKFYKISRPLKYKTTYNEFSFGDSYLLHSKNVSTDFAVVDGGIAFTTGDRKMIITQKSISSHKGEHCNIRISESEITLGDEQYSTPDVKITSGGIKFKDRKNTEIPVADGSGFADLNDYAKKSEILPATKESLGVVKVGDGLNVTDGTISVDTSSILIDILSYGVEWDTTVADPACTRIGNMSYHKSLPIQSEYKGCLVKNGKVNYYLDPNDWSKKADGTPSVLDGTDGDVMVHIPKFYGKSGSNGNKRWVRIATTRIDSSWVEIPEMFVSAYRITTYTESNTSKVASVVNTTANYRGGSNRADYDQYLGTDEFRTDLGKPRTNISRATMRAIANNSGQELLCYEFYKWVFYWAYVIEYANFNSQKKFNSELTSDGYHQGGLGKGLTTLGYQGLDSYNDNNPITPCGYTNEFGNFSGEKVALLKLDSSKTLTTTHINRWRGFENPFGDIFTNLDGIVLKRDSSNTDSNVYTTSDSSKFGDDPSVMNIAGIETYGGGYIKEFDLKETGEIIPKLVLPGGSESTYKCDKHVSDGWSTDERTLFVGGCATLVLSDWSGLGHFSSIDTTGSSGSAIGFRSVIRVH